MGAQVTATKADGTLFVSTISSIAANATAADWNGTTQTWSAPGTGGWVVNADAALQAPSALANGTLIDSGATATLSGLTVAQGAAAGVSLGMLAVGTIPSTQGNSYFFPATTDGRPFPAAEAHPAAVTALSEASGLEATFSAATGQGNVNLGTSFLTLFGSGANPGGFATLASFATNPPADATGIGITVGNLLTTRQILPANVSTPTAPQISTYMVLAGVSGNVPIKSVESFTVTLADAVPVDGGKPVALTFATSVTGSVASSTSFTIDAATYPGIVVALALGQKPTLAAGSASSSEHTITQLRQGDGKITVGLSGSLPAGWPLGTPITVSLPPTGGSLPTYKWNASDATRNSIWARQTATAGQVPAVNGSRIYVSLVQPGQPGPTMQFSVANGVVAVTQFDTAQVWQGQIAPSQYVELAADSLGAGGQSSSQGKVYVDLSAVDGFFFPVALSTTIAGKALLIGQPAGPYTAPNTTGPRTYMPVARNEILSAWKDFFDDTSNFATGSDALRQAYAGLRIVNDGIPAGIQNPSFLWSMPNANQASKNALNAAWNAHLDTLFSGTGQVDLMGDQTSLVRGYVNAVQVNPSGTGYKSTDTVTFSEPSSGGRRAQGTIVIGESQTGNISGITITDPGDYALADKPTITIHSSTGSAAVATVTAFVPAATYYKGVATTVNFKPAIQFTEYAAPPMNGAWQLSYDATSATGAVFTVYDPRNPPADLNGDGIGDTIWRKTDAQGGTVGYVGWLYDAQGEVVAKRGLSKGPDWDLETAAYFTTGPVTDFVWRNTKSNATMMWIMNNEGSTAKQKYIGGKDTPEWQVETSGDYDGDGRTDLVWRQSTTGAHSMWLMNEWHVSGQAIIGGSKTFRLVATAADYDANGDGCTDLIWRDTTSDGHVVHLMQGTAQIGSCAVADGTGWDLVATGNYDTNGISDLLWREKSTGAVMQWLMTTTPPRAKANPRREGRR